MIALAHVKVGVKKIVPVVVRAPALETVKAIVKVIVKAIVLGPVITHVKEDAKILVAVAALILVREVPKYKKHNKNGQ